LPALAAVVAFAPALGNGFVNWDDYLNITTNHDFRGLGGPQLRWAWTTFHLGVYQPLSWLVLEAEYALWGLDPRGYHLTSLLLSAVVAVALHALAVAVQARSRPSDHLCDPWPDHLGAGLAVALFVAHPLRAEVVVWASCQPYLCCALFSVLSVLAYLRAHPADGPARAGWAAGAFLLFAAALLSKAVAVSLPVVLVILDAYPLRRRRTWRAWAEKLPYFALALVFMRVAVLAKREFAATNYIPDSPGTLAERAAQACYAACFYLVKTAWPVGVAAYYPRPDRVEWSDPRFFLSGFAVAGLTVALLLARRHLPGLLAAWTSYLVILAPNSGLVVRVGGQIAADRYSYISMIGLVTAAAAGLSRLLASRRRAVPVAAAGLAALAVLTALSWEQCRVWRDSLALWTHAVARSGAPGPMLHMFLGETLLERGGYEESLEHFSKALQMSPDSVDAGRKVGIVLLRLGRLGDAAPYLVETIRRRPDDAQARGNYGELLLRLGRTREAAGQLAEAVRSMPDEPSFRGNLGLALLRLGRLDEAQAQFHEVLRLKPDADAARGALVEIARARKQRGMNDE
jgi:Flp pilus assembly protein TadD